jgi:hypothetical protein
VSLYILLIWCLKESKTDKRAQDGRKLFLVYIYIREYFVVSSGRDCDKCAEGRDRIAPTRLGEIRFTKRFTESFLFSQKSDKSLDLCQFSPEF